MREAGFVIDPAYTVSCSLSGLATARGKLIDLKELADGLADSIKHIDGAATRQDLLNKGLFALRLVKASCDAFFAIGGALNEEMAVGAEMYGHASSYAEPLGKSIAGQPAVADWAKAGIGSTAHFAKEKWIPGGSNTSGIRIKEAFVKTQEVKSKVLVDALNQNEEAVKEDMRGYGLELGRMMVEAAKKPRLTKAFSLGESLVTAGMAYLAAYEGYREDEKDKTDFAGIKRGLAAQAEGIRQRIASLESAIAACTISGTPG